MISAVSNIHFCNKYPKAVSFGSLEREVFEDKERTKIKHRNNTNLFRNDINWNRVTKFITSGNKPKKIYCYACSDGSEPYTIAIMLISKLGWDGAKKYFPIIAKDIDPYAIHRAKSGYIKLMPTDIIAMMEHQKAPLSDFFIFKRNCHIPNWKYSTFKVSDKLRQCVYFEKGDILTDIGSLNYDNAIIFFRNVWPYLNEEQQDKLMSSFAKNFKENSAVIVGGFDEDPKENYFLYTDFEKKMKKHGLYNTKPRTYQKYNTKTFRDFIRVLWSNIIY